MKTTFAIIGLIFTALASSGQVLLTDAVIQGASFSGVATGGGSTNAPSIVQSNYLYTSWDSYSNFSQSLPANATAGNMIIVEANSLYTAPTATISDTSGDGNNWTVLDHRFYNDGWTSLWIWYKTNCIATNYVTTITLAEGSVAYNGLTIYEVSGVKTVAPVDAFVATANESAAFSLALSPALTPSAAGDLICVFASLAGGACTNMPGYSVIYGTSFATIGVPAMGWKVSNGTSETPTAYWDTSARSLLQAVALKPK